eukprot:m.257508 g.257508  ORF g.257508 m.257508 type:complete len:135 (-) comp15958_c0_seq16:703-1107(-)
MACETFEYNNNLMANESFGYEGNEANAQPYFTVARGTMPPGVPATGTTLIYHTQGDACRATGSKESPPARNTAQIYLVCDPNAVDPTPSVLAERLEQCEVDLLLKTTAVCNYRCYDVSLSVACLILLLLGAAPL